MSQRFTDLRLSRQVSTPSEAISVWIALPLALMVLALVGFLLGQFFPQSFG